MDIAMIDVDVYYAACGLKIAQIFALSMKDLEYPIEKKAKLDTNSKTIVFAEYHDLLNVL